MQVVEIYGSLATLLKLMFIVIAVSDLTVVKSFIEINYLMFLKVLITFYDVLNVLFINLIKH